MSNNCEDCVDLFAIAKAIAQRYEDDRRARAIQLDEEGYADEARAAAYADQEWWRDFNERNPK